MADLGSTRVFGDLTVTGDTFSNGLKLENINITAGTNVTVTGTYPDITISSTDTNTTYTAGSGLSLVGTTFTNTAPHVATNLSYTSSTRLLTSSTGTNVTLPQVTTSTDGLMIAADKTKLNGITAGATKNATDAQLRNRATHTGTQTLSTISDAGNLASKSTNGVTTNYLRGDGTWAIPPNTTYAAMSVAEGEAGTATTSRTVRADYLKQIIEHYTAQVSGAVNGSFYESENVITQNYTVGTGKNSMVAGPITVNDGVTITVPDGSTLIIV